MNLTSAREGPWKVLTPDEARLDASVSDTLKKLLDDALADGTRDIAIDLSAVEFMDSSGLGAFVHFRRSLGEEGRLAMVGARSNVLTLLKITNLDKVFLLVSELTELRQLEAAG